MTPKVICYGEILWDVFPTHTVIGGAPLNVALRIQSFGIPTAVISRLGKDDLGNKALAFIVKRQLNADLIQFDENLETGYVKVILDDSGAASYEIHKPVAWDMIQLTNDNKNAVSAADVFVFGSLACRSEISKKTLLQLLHLSNHAVFDVNLRPPDYDLSFIVEVISQSHTIKLNDDELDEIADFLGFQDQTMETQIQLLAQQTQTTTICVTKGGAGALLFFKGKFYNNNGYQVTVEDTVGAGDSFLAALIFKLFIKALKPQESLDFACQVGALVASKKGATTQLTEEDFKKLIS
ncbi:MAG: carbohydrate kinase [Algicola sp.]|nr:carbohydrate kinase [Algicola sp.]